MLNNTATRPLELENGQAADFGKVATFYRQRARANEAAGAASFGWIRAACLAEAAKLRRSAEIAEDLHAYDLANPRDLAN